VETLKLNARLRTEEPEVLLDPTLPVGRYVASLVVASERGESAAATVRFTVLRAVVRPSVGDPVLPVPAEPVRPAPAEPVRPAPVEPIRPVPVRPGVRPSGTTPAVAPTPPRAAKRTPGRKKPSRKKPQRKSKKE
jgi:hypothetical protein